MYLCICEYVCVLYECVSSYVFESICMSVTIYMNICVCAYMLERECVYVYICEIMCVFPNICVCRGKFLRRIYLFSICNEILKIEINRQHKC